jgi:hypothetical protein
MNIVSYGLGIDIDILGQYVVYGLGIDQLLPDDVVIRHTIEQELRTWPIYFEMRETEIE